LHLGFAAIIFWVLKGPKAPFEVLQVPQLPLYTPALHFYPNLFSLFFASLPPRERVFLRYFGHFARRTQKGAYPSPLSFP
jgi:hypothetical protein